MNPHDSWKLDNGEKPDETVECGVCRGYGVNRTRMFADKNHEHPELYHCDECDGRGYVRKLTLEEHLENEDFDHE